jgi:hypothetical protein
MGLIPLELISSVPSRTNVNNPTTYCIAFVLDLCGPSWNFTSKTAEIVAEIFLVVNCVHCFAETARTTSRLSAFEWTNVQTVAQEEFLVERR